MPSCPYIVASLPPQRRGQAPHLRGARVAPIRHRHHRTRQRNSRGLPTTFDRPGDTGDGQFEFIAMELASNYVQPLVADAMYRRANEALRGLSIGVATAPDMRGRLAEELMLGLVEVGRGQQTHVEVKHVKGRRPKGWLRARSFGCEPARRRRRLRGRHSRWLSAILKGLSSFMVSCCFFIWQPFVPRAGLESPWHEPSSLPPPVPLVQPCAPPRPAFPAALLLAAL